MSERILEAKALADSDPQKALKILNDILNENPDSADSEIALFMVAYVLMNQERNGLAYHILQRCAQMRPNRSEIYSNMGMCFDVTDKERAIQLHSKAIQLDKKNANAIANKALMYLQTGKPQQCIQLSDEALKLDPTLRSAQHNKGLAKLMLRDWSGWDEYHQTNGVKNRELRDYGLLEWDGEEGVKVVVYGEQGVGDEIMFASVLPDLAARCQVVFDCDSRLEGIFKRSFDFPVYGTRFHKRTPLLDDHEPEYQIAIGQLPYYFRRADECFPGEPFLHADHERVIQWDAIMGDGPRIGFSMYGGIPSNMEKERSTELDTFSDLFGHNLINLDYKEVDEQAMQQHGIKYWPRGVKKGADLEELFAIVANCDLVITVCTTVVYIAGALGIPCHVLVPNTPGYRYHASGSNWPWFKNVTLWRGDFKKSIRKIMDAEGLHRVRQQGSGRVSRLSA